MDLSADFSCDFCCSLSCACAANGKAASTNAAATAATNLLPCDMTVSKCKLHTHQRAITRMLARIAALAGTVVPGCDPARAQRAVHRAAMIVPSPEADKRPRNPAAGLFPLRRTLLCCRQTFGSLR